MLMRLGVVSLEIERHALGQVCLVKVRRLVERLAVESEGVVQLAVAAELLALLHEVGGTAGCWSLRGRLLGETKRDEQE
jgi:hypothetical protein